MCAEIVWIELDYLLVLSRSQIGFLIVKVSVRLLREVSNLRAGIGVRLRADLIHREQGRRQSS
jgi:hypothetical protein